MTENTSGTKPSFKWRHPSEVMRLLQLKKKKNALQARINSSGGPSQLNLSKNDTTFNDVLAASKRKNPFVINTNSKRAKLESVSDESNDQTLFKLLHVNQAPQGKENITSFDNILRTRNNDPISKSELKAIGEKWIPIDWALNTKLRFLSSRPFAWNSKLKISEEASGITAFARCLDTGDATSSLDTSPNSQFHQCSLYWQQPSLPWLTLFPRSSEKASSASGDTASATVRESLRRTWMDGCRSLFQLVRTRQCPYFYACANNFTVLFRAAGICGSPEVRAYVTPTTRGFRHLLRQEEIEYTMPLKKKRASDSGLDSMDSTSREAEDEEPDEWLESMGINSEDIKHINYTQAKIVRQAESEVDNSEQSMILIEGPEVQAFQSFLVHCKSTIALTGPYAGIPPTLIAPVAFNGATLMALKVRESKLRVDDKDYYSLDLAGPILPHVIHNLCHVHPKDNTMTATFSTYAPTMAFSKVAGGDAVTEATSGCAVFREENLSDCGLMPKVLKHFCSADPRIVSSVECLKYTAETNSYAWT